MDRNGCDLCGQDDTPRAVLKQRKEPWRYACMAIKVCKNCLLEKVKEIDEGRAHFPAAKARA